MTRFVNPYNFVPLAGDVDSRRERPRGHRHAKGALSGWLDVTMEATTPISTQTVAGTARPEEMPIRGSSLRGALRSMHEALTGSCLRVFDTEFVPVYREHMSTAAGRTLALVQQVRHKPGTGEVLSLDLYLPPARDVVSVPMSACPGLPTDRDGVRTGTRLSVVGVRGEEWSGRVATQVTLSADGDHVLLVSSTAARPPDKVDRWKFRAVKAPGSIEEEELKQRSRSVGRLVLTTLNAAAGSMVDRKITPVLRDPVMGPDGWTYDGVGNDAYNRGAGGVLFGRRLVACGPDRELLKDGQPVWVNLDEHGQIARVGLSQIWRAPGEGRAGERAGEATPCRGPELCPSCRVFGSVEHLTPDEKADVVANRGAEQNSYMGHVWIGSADYAEIPQVHLVDLPRVDAPRPGAGQFYLVDRTIDVHDKSASRLPERGQARREWGSAADRGRPRELRGRKRYWTTSQTPRVTEVTGEISADDHVSRRACVPAGTRFTWRVVFEGLSPEQVGGLVGACAPRLWLEAWQGHEGDPADARFRLGGGQPFGLGAAIGEVELHVEDMRKRWTGLPGDATAQVVDLRTLVEEFVASAPQKVRETWLALANLVSQDHVDPDMVSYPRHGGVPMEEAPFYFWKGSVGRRRTNRDGTRITPFIALPTADLAGDSQVLDTATATVPEGKKLGGGRA
ncbi:RAMP superfamily CRISPR-associated protein [Ornithinimicrobium avium]|uniref:CRISPR-associated protein n=1 Tax=Ornithinimicrobium avium TaxID=2283195 RepID=A0A345NLQ6_9MICO|nr:RAMP superfamily CRISPR-associated protein [Ornithinimicrobium avium]AXH95964.1 hypothetical protein DV701_07360 [Ornithinimicrobium avium]